ncbi:MAG: hypothetical protein NTX59_05205 [Elusimicrobia bacterium]|nr:hypothetical protein [Elusimicrobiota bacterium]
MKKSMLAAVTLIAFAGLSFAQAPAAAPVAAPAAAPKVEAPKAVKPAVRKHVPAPKAEIMMGEITAVDTVKNEITVKDKKTAVEKTIGVDVKKIAGFKVGEEVKVKTQGDKTDVKVIKKHEGKHMGKHEGKKPEAPVAPAAAAAGK